MNHNYRQDFIKTTSGFSEKEIEKYHVNHIINLFDKIKNKDDEDIYELLVVLKSTLSEEKINQKIYSKTYSKLTSIVESRFGYKEVGSMKNRYIGLGLLFGVSLGVSMSNFFTSSLPIFLSVGLTIGVALGSKKEKEAEDKDLLY